MKSNIVYNQKVVITEVIGHHTGPNRKEVVNKTTGEIYASRLDAAKALETCVSNIYAHLRGDIKTCKGYELESLDHTSGNTDSLAKANRKKYDRIAQLEARIAELETDAAIGRAIREAKEAEVKAKANAKLNYDKATEKVERRQRMFDRKLADLQGIDIKLTEAKEEQRKAWEIMMQFEEA